MTKRRKTAAAVEPRFVLPGAEADVHAFAYSHGLDALPNVFFMQLPPGIPVAGDYVLLGAGSPEEIEETIRGVTAIVEAPELNEERPLTNSKALFRVHYANAFAEGYRFGLYAISHGLIHLLSLLPAERRYTLCYAFAWERFMGESPYVGVPENEGERLMLQSLESLRELHKNYKALN